MAADHTKGPWELKMFPLSDRVSMNKPDRMSLHLGPERMARLRLLGFATGRKMHPMVLEAVDQYLEAVQQLVWDRDRKLAGGGK